MYIAFNAPHDPRQSPKRFIDMYPLDKIRIPANFMKENPWKDGMGCPKTLRDERLAPFPRTTFAVKVHRQEYYAAITYLDEQIGRIINALKKSGKYNDTYIIFTADQGLAVGHHGLMGKQNMFEHSMRVPLFISGPGIPKDKVIDVPVYMQDIMPTVLALAGTEIPKWVEFHNLLPLITKQKKDGYYNEIYGKYIGFQRMIIKDEFKLIAYPQIHKFLLFNIKKDPDEINNLAENPEYASVVQKMKHELENLMKKMNDTMNLDNPKPPSPHKQRRKKHK
jgi:arylsulfatase A-like enzyme